MENLKYKYKVCELLFDEGLGLNVTIDDFTYSEQDGNLSVINKKDIDLNQNNVFIYFDRKLCIVLDKAMKETKLIQLKDSVELAIMFIMDIIKDSKEQEYLRIYQQKIDKVRQYIAEEFFELSSIVNIALFKFIQNEIYFDNKSIMLKRADECINLVCKTYGIEKHIALGNRRIRELVECRAMISYILRKKINMTYQDIGTITNRDHSTVMHHITVHENKIATEKEYQKHYSNVINQLEMNLINLITKFEDEQD